MWWFLDDERFPPDNGEEWVIFRTGEELLSSLEMDGWPEGISFDHDLGDNVISGHKTIMQMIDMIGYGEIPNPTVTKFLVHSENQVGVRNIKATIPDLYIVPFGGYMQEV